MIDFSLSPELEAIRQRVRTFIADVVKPAEERIQSERLRATERERFLQTEWPQLVARLARLGISAADLTWPKESE